MSYKRRRSRVNSLSLGTIYNRVSFNFQKPWRYQNIFEVINFSKKQKVLWQLLDQCSIAVQAINLKVGYLVGNMSCVIHKRTQQETTTVFY